MVEASKEMQKYFQELEDECMREIKVANSARSKGYDYTTHSEIVLARNMAERVIGIIAVVAPQIQNSGTVERIIELEKQYGILDWRVAFTIAEEVAREKFCKFKDQKEAMEIGIKTGFAYVTNGVVSSPLEGFTNLDIMDRMDGQGKYFCINFSGPIRNAGGTASAVCVLIADFVRMKFGFAKYDATELETKRTYTEVEDYHTKFSPRQYFPSREEIDFLMKNIPIQIGAESSEKYEVSNYKDLPRVPVNLVRSGFCLLYSDCLPLKAPKLWKQLKVWGKEFGMNDWMFLEEYLNIQKAAKAHKKKGDSSTSKISPDYTYIKDLVAGRPVLGYPLRIGGFRLRYGRGRVSGYSAQSIHPATMHVLNDYVATATQLKVERPGKAAAMTVCDTIEGPIVKLYNGNVLMLDTEILAKQYKKEVKEILFLGDVLIAYGDFFNRNHLLVPPGYCQEMWILDLEKSALEKFSKSSTNQVIQPNEKKEFTSEQIFGYKNIDFEKFSQYIRIPQDKLEILFKRPLKTKISCQAAIEISKKMDVPLHPQYTYFWKTITFYDLKNLIHWFEHINIVRFENIKDNLIEKIILPKNDAKRVLEILGIPHLFVNNEFVVIEEDIAQAVISTLNIHDLLLKEDIEAMLKQINEIIDLKSRGEAIDEDVLSFINKISQFKISDKAGVFIGSRMGRPEKAKMRKLTGQPHTLFPVGEDGGKLRSFQAAMLAGKVTAQFPIFYCEKCKKKTVFALCETCDKQTTRLTYCMDCKNTECTNATHRKATTGMYDLDIKSVFSDLLKRLDTKIYPDMIKGIRGTVNKEHLPEHLIKGILRAKHGINVNKDGTTRYDASEIPITHFKPKEIGVSVEKLRKLGYTKDTKGRSLERDEQILEIKPQDILLPCCPESPDESADEVLFRTSKFIDELLEKLYGLKPYYKLESKEDIVGHLVIGLAPHTSAGILGRIIGFTKTQGFYSHPMYHAAMRRDTDGDESCVFLLMDGLLNFSKQYFSDKRGATMDAPLVLTYVLNPAEVDDMVFDLDIGWRYPIEFYQAALDFKPAGTVKINQMGKFIGTAGQYEGMGFTHDTDDINAGVLCSQYKLLPSMEEKLFGQMDLATKIRAVDTSDVARLVIEKHFIRDIKGNLRKFSTQQFRCGTCNEKYRRPPLAGKCLKCTTGKIIFTISEGSIVKYLEPTISLGEKFNIPTYLKQTIELTKRRVEEYFGKDEERQEGLGKWFG
ncbi:MAG: DNA polymerase II large subunit [Candidatus Woesearchaeota archaeon]